MILATLEERKRKVIDLYGEWTDHNIHLGGGVYTIAENWQSEKLRRVVQIVSDMSGGGLQGVRILDLGCLEGQYAIEFALHGAHCTGIEGRTANIEKARFVKETLGIENLTLVQDDIRNLTKERYGEFDVVLCLGILYHLDTPDVLQFVEQISAVCKRFAVFDTFVGLRKARAVDFQGKTYWGRHMQEHANESSAEERLRDVWASIDNPNSFWITRASLYNLLSANGFTSVYDCQIPAELHKPSDRLTLLGVKGKLQTICVTPKSNQTPPPDWPEGFSPRISMRQRKSRELSEMVSGMVPRVIKQPLKNALGLMRATAPNRWQNWNKKGRG